MKAYRWIVGGFVLALAAAWAPHAAAQWGGGPELKVEPMAAADGVHPGGSLRVALKCTLTEGWHTNSHEPLDEFLKPTRVTFDPIDGVTMGTIVYPEPELLSFSFSEAPMSVFEEEFVIGAEVLMAESVPEGPLTLTGKIDYQACNDTQCAAPTSVPFALETRVVPVSQEPAAQHGDVFAALDFSAGADAGAPGGGPAAETVVEPQRGGPRAEAAAYLDRTAAAPGGTVRIALAVTLESGWHVNSDQPLEEFAIATALTVETPEGWEAPRVVYPEAEMQSFPYSEGPMPVFGHQFTVGAELRVPDSAAPGEVPVTLALRYQPCNDEVCAAPNTLRLDVPIPVAEAAGDAQHADRFAGLGFDDAGASADVPSTPADVAPKGGTAAVPSADWREHADAFSVAGVGAGYMNTDAFTTFIAEAEAGNAPGRNPLEGRGAFVVIALTLIGGLALNLTPCVLPLIPINVAIIGAGAMAGSRSRGFLLGTAYGVGMAAVYGLLGLAVVLGGSTFGAINASPWFNLSIAALFVVLALAMFDVLIIDFTKYQSKLGMKKNTKGSFGVALFMGSVTALLAGACIAPAVIAVLGLSLNLYTAGVTLALGLPFLLGLGMALPWPFAGAGLSFLPKPGAWMSKVKYAFGVLILGFAGYYGYLGYSLMAERWVDQEAVLASVQELDEDGWTPSLGDGLAQAAAEGKPVLIDFWATWCKSCLTMNKTTLKEPAVLAALEDYVKIKYQAEDPSDPETAAVMDHYGVQGLPTYIILTPSAG